MSDQERSKRKSAKQAQEDSLVAEDAVIFEDMNEDAAAEEIFDAESSPSLKDIPTEPAEGEAKKEQEKPEEASDADLAEASPPIKEMSAEPAGADAQKTPEKPEEISDGDILEQAQKLAIKLTEEKEHLFQQFLRLQADFDNFRKRNRQERTNLVNMANAGLIQSLLPVLDNFERAINALSESSEREGVQLIQRQLLEALSAAGLTPIEAVGADFDPQLHEAILQSDAGPEQKGKVLGEAEKGYMLNGKLLRASRVHVGG